jgi:hypothetical protein
VFEDRLVTDFRDVLSNEVFGDTECGAEGG